MAIVPIVANQRTRGQLPRVAGLHGIPRILAPVYTPPVVITVGAARILVQQDFDPRLLRAVIHALGEPS